MKRGLLVSLSVLALGWLAGCGGSGSISSGGTPPQANTLNGQYAFVMAGFDATGFPMGMAGSFKADGFGHITAGEVDVNDNGTAATSSSVSGTYSFDNTGSGNNTTLGTVSLSTTVGTVATHALGFAFSLQASGGFGQIMSLDQNGFFATGTMQLQSSSAFTLAALAGDFVVSLDGRTSSSPTSALGSFTLASSGATSNDTFDRSIAGSATAGPTTGASAALTFSGTAPDSNGRGTFTLTLNDGLVVPPVTQNFSYYAISAKRIVAVETDSSGAMTADFASQTIPATPTTTGSVFGMAGLDTALSDEISAVGQLQMTGVGAATGTLNWDANDAVDGSGSVFTANSSTLDAVAYDATTGRGTVTVSGGNAHGIGDTLVFYLSGAGTGFVLDATAGASNRAMAGPLTAQASGSFSAATDLSGLGIFRSRGSSVNDAFSLVGLFGPSTGTSPYTALFDVRQPGSADSLDQTTGITVGPIAGTVGRGTFAFTGSGTTNAFYIIGPNQFVFIDITQSDGASPVFFVNPD